MATPLKALQKSKYLDIVLCLWDYGAEETHEEYPELSVDQLNKANAYCDSLRCEGCMCGSCVRLGELSSDLPNSPADLKPIADLAVKLGEEAFKKQGQDV